MIKLIAYNLKFGKNKHLLMALIILLVSIGIRVSLLSTSSISDQENVATIVAVGFFCLLIFAAGISSLVVILNGLYRNVFGKQGYLMQTLPITKHRLVQSQYIVALLWFNLMLVVTVISLIIIAFSRSDWTQIDWSLLDGFTLVTILLMVNVSVLFLIATVFMGMALANSSFGFRKIHPIIATGVAFFYMNMLGIVEKFFSDTGWFPGLVLVRTEAGLHFTTQQGSNHWNDFQQTMDIRAMLFTIVFIIGAYFITVWLMEKHTDL